MPLFREETRNEEAAPLHLAWLAKARQSPLLATALLLVVFKSIQFAVDSQVLFYNDSGAFLLNALGFAFIPERSYVYGWLIRAFAVTSHSLRAIVTMQVLMGGFAAWLLAFALMRYLRVRWWIATLAACLFAFDPMQIVQEHLILAETTAMLATALLLVAVLQYLLDLSAWWLVVVSLLGVVLVSLRIVYLPVVLAGAVLLPVCAYFASSLRRPRVLAVALAVSCGSTTLFHLGYRHLTGRLAGREPAYHYRTGSFLVAVTAPLVQARDAIDVRVAGAVLAQNQSRLPLSDPALRAHQMWSPDGLVARLRAVFPGDEREADKAAERLAHTAILRDPLGFVRLGLHTYLEYWRSIPSLDRILPPENGTGPVPALTPSDVRMILATFGTDVSNQNTLHTPSRRYHLRGRYWNVFLLASPLLGFLILWSKAVPIRGSAPLVVWSFLLLTATCLGAGEVAYRYLHPFSFTGLAVAAAILETSLVRRVSGGKRRPNGDRATPAGKASSR